MPARRRDRRTRGGGGAGSGFRVASAGRVVPAKDYPNLLRAFQQSAQGGARCASFGLPVPPRTQRRSFLPKDVVSHWLSNGRGNGFAGTCALARLASRPARAARCRRRVCAGVGVGGDAAGSCRGHGHGKTRGRDGRGRRARVGGGRGMLVPAKDPAALAEAMLATMRRSREERARVRDARRGSGSCASSAWMPRPIGGRRCTGSCSIEWPALLSVDPRKRKGRSKLAPAFDDSPANSRIRTGRPSE